MTENSQIGSGSSSLNDSEGCITDVSEGCITDDSPVLPAFCQSLESVLRQGLKVGGLGMLGLLDRDYWNCIEGFTTSSRITIRPPPSVSHVIHIVKQCKKVTSSQGRGRLFLRVALTKCVLVQALEALLDNPAYISYWYHESSPLVDHRRKGIVLDILKSLKKKMYKLSVNNCSFLNETWLIPRIETHEFVPSAHLGITLVAKDGKAVTIDVLQGSAADEVGIERGDCVEELNGIVIDEKLAFKVGAIKRKFQGKPLVVSVVKARYKDGRWFPPLSSRFQSLCNSGRCRALPPIDSQKESEKKLDTDQRRVTSKHVFTITYLNTADVGTNGSSMYVQDGISSVLETDNVEKVKVKLELMERDIVILYEDTNKLFGRYSYTETSSCAIKDDNPNVFGFITGNTTCSFADSFNCHVFSSEDQFAVKQIIEGIGKGFDRTVYCV